MPGTFNMMLVKTTHIQVIKKAKCGNMTFVSEIAIIATCITSLMIRATVVHKHLDKSFN